VEWRLNVFDGLCDAGLILLMTATVQEPRSAALKKIQISS
jgi:hypothetical protein